MMQDWTWWCHGCGKRVEPYECHDMEECYKKHGVKMPEGNGCLVFFLFIAAAPLVGWWFV